MKEIICSNNGLVLIATKNSFKEELNSSSLFVFEICLRDLLFSAKLRFLLGVPNEICTIKEFLIWFYSFNKNKLHIYDTITIVSSNKEQIVKLNKYIESLKFDKETIEKLKKEIDDLDELHLRKGQKTYNYLWKKYPETINILCCGNRYDPQNDDTALDLFYNRITKNTKS